MAKRLHLVWGDAGDDEILYESFDLPGITSRGNIKIADDTDWSEDSGGQIDIIVDGDKVYAAWDGNHIIKFAKSIDLGATWSSPANIIDAGSDFISRPRLAVDSTGRIFLAWREKEAFPSPVAHFKCARSTDDGANWLTTTAHSADRSYRLRLEVDSADNVYIFAFTDDEGDGQCFKSADNGATFGAGVSFMTGLGAGDAWLAVIGTTVDASDNLHVSMRAKDLTDGWDDWRQISWVSSDNGASFAGPNTVSAISGASRSTRMIFGGGYVYCFWAKPNTGADPGYWYSNSSTDGVSWNSDALVESSVSAARASNYHQQGHCGGVDADGTIYFIYRVEDEFRVKTAVAGAASWSTKTILHTGSTVMACSAVVAEVTLRPQTYFFLA